MADNAPVSCVDAFNPAEGRVQNDFRSHDQDQGQDISRVSNVVPSGRFKKPNKAAGTLEYSSGGCVGDYRFTGRL